MPEVNYKVKLSDGEYYPAHFDIIEFDEKGRPYLKKEGWAEIWFYVPNKRDRLSLNVRSLDIKHLTHLNFPDLKDESPRAFIHKDLAELLVKGDFSKISPLKIRSATEIQDYQKYFDIFKSKDEPFLDSFSSFLGTALSPDKK